MTTWPEAIDDAIDMLLQQDPHCREFDRNDLASISGCLPAHISSALQMHRDKQSVGATRHIIASRGYGRQARWYILAMGKKGQKLTVGQAQHIANDLAVRAKSDIISELSPAQAMDPLVQNILDKMASTIEASVVTCVGLVEVLAEMTSRLGISPDLSNVRQAI
jgi:hypothetical protein